MFPNENSTVSCGRHPGSSCTQAHDFHVASLIERNHKVEELEYRIKGMNDEFAELICAKEALIEVLKMAVLPSPGKRTLILKTEGGEESQAFLIPQEEVESVLSRYG